MDSVDIHDLISEEIGEQLAQAGQSKCPAVTCTIEDVLTPEDISAYCEASGSLPAVKSDEKDVATLRARHHQVARYLAAGLAEGIVAELTGYTAPYISTLKQAPNMLELIAHYKLPGDNATKQIAEKLRLLADMSLEQAIQKVTEGDFDNNQLLAAIKLGADRSNNGPMSKVDHSVTHSLDEEQVRKLADSARKRNADRIIPIEAVRQALPAPRREGQDAT
jgi:hypothetical protein